MRAGTQAAAAHGSPVRAPGIWIRRLARSSVRVDSALVGDGETLAAFCSTPLQDDAAVLRRHANSETVSLLSPTGVRLISSLALHVVSSFNRDPAGARASAHDVRDITAHLAARSVGETSILAVAKRQCQRDGGRRWAFLIARWMKKWRRSHLNRRSFDRPLCYIRGSPTDQCASRSGILFGMSPQDFHNCGNHCGKAGWGVVQFDATGPDSGGFTAISFRFDRFFL